MESRRTRTCKVTKGRLSGLRLAMKGTSAYAQRITLATRSFLRRAPPLISRMASSGQPSITVPQGYTLHKENTTHILLPEENGAFLNPVQEFNRDLSVACIRIWSERADRAKQMKWSDRQVKQSAKKIKPSGQGGICSRSIVQPSLMVVYPSGSGHESNASVARPNDADIGSASAAPSTSEPPAAAPEVRSTFLRFKP
jgi:hypothetical protein